MSTLSNKNYYEILEITNTSSQEEIAEAYRNLSLKYHPSKASPENKEVYELHFQKLAEAYEVLSDPTKKGMRKNRMKFPVYLVPPSAAKIIRAKKNLAQLILIWNALWKNFIPDV